MKIYVSGPMSGMEDYNYPAFNRAAEHLRQQGHAVLNPAENFVGRNDLPRDKYLREDLRMLSTAEAVALLLGWEDSPGARMEVRVGLELGLRFLRQVPSASKKLWFKFVDRWAVRESLHNSSQRELKSGGDEGSEEAGSHYDKGKPRVDLIPPEELIQVAEVMGLGAEKYSEWNWAKGVRLSRYYGSLSRHVLDWYAGSDQDEESGKHPLAHAACCCLILMGIQRIHGDRFDDRPCKRISLTS